ncbi:MAG: precorrin-6y C5,15-methyltransferase (decarboxylating) subunit CbiE [Bacteroidaceae bacterium]|nr:precorrin-6y C5,15-methyltransferase (decarboxylating) subunit CbiE [Bacteroidaceae bacterium]
MNCELKFIVIGITDNPKPFFTPDVLEIIKNGRVFSGGKRHHEIVAPLLPKDAQWIDITVPLDKVFEDYNGQWSMVNGQCIIVFASGDPLFFGFANTIKRKMPEAEIVVYPTFNSLQMLAHRLVMPYHDMRVVSLTGRPWQEFDKALIERVGKIGILTDKEHTPAAIAQRMMEYGYTYYEMHVGEHLGNPELERVTSLSLEEASAKDFSMPNCVILESCGQQTTDNGQRTTDKRQQTTDLPRLQSRLGAKASKNKHPFGVPDSEFVLLDGREKMITKMPVRLLTLQALELPKRHVFWDIGFCTGSVSIEARLQFPHLQIEAFEIRPECEAIIQENARKHGAPGINVHMGDFLVNCDSVATNGTPDAVFIGGHGGRLKEIMEKVLTVLADDGVIVFNSVVAPKVLTDSRQLWDEACEELGLHQELPLHIQLNDNHPITILKGKKVKS